jgi:DNA-binding transcriptional regulator YiaG
VSPTEFRAARHTLGLTQAAMAEALEVTLRAVQWWEAGDREVPGPARVALRLMLQRPSAVPSQRSTAAGRGTRVAWRS